VTDHEIEKWRSIIPRIFRWPPSSIIELLRASASIKRICLSEYSSASSSNMQMQSMQILAEIYNVLLKVAGLFLYRFDEIKRRSMLLEALHLPKVLCP
jgi:hypothetical protein